jgi:hypothetical protein
MEPKAATLKAVSVPDFKKVLRFIMLIGVLNS